MQIWKGVLGWEALFSWASVGTIFFGLGGAGLALMALDWVPQNLLLAQICFCVAALILAAKLIRHAALSKDPWWHRMIFSFIVCGVLGVAATEVVRLLENEKAKREAKAEAKTQSQAESAKQNATETTDVPIPESGAIVVVRNLEVSQPKANQPFSIKIILRNRGKLPATMNHGQAYKLTDGPLTREEQDTGFAVATAMMKPSATANMSEMQPGDDSRFFTSPNEFMRTEDCNDVIAGKKRLYLMVVMHFHDTSMPEGAVGITEWCGYFHGTFSSYY